MPVNAILKLAFVQLYHFVHILSISVYRHILLLKVCLEANKRILLNNCKTPENNFRQLRSVLFLVFMHWQNRTTETHSGSDMSCAGIHAMPQPTQDFSHFANVCENNLY